MVIAKAYFKNSLNILGIIVAIAGLVAELYDFGMMRYYCFQGSSFLGWDLSVYPFCRPVFFGIEIVLAMLSVLILAVLGDFIMWPIRVIIRKRKNRVEIVENFLYK